MGPQRGCGGVRAIHVTVPAYRERNLQTGRGTQVILALGLALHPLLSWDEAGGGGGTRASYFSAQGPVPPLRPKVSSAA